MSCSKLLRLLLGFCGMILVAMPSPLLACAVCFGKTDSRLAQGMNWGIFSLLVVVVCVLGGISAFFVFLAKKSAAMSGGALSTSLPESTKKA